jgi:hypothetical protein
MCLMRHTRLQRVWDSLSLGFPQLGTRCHCVDLPLSQKHMFSHARDMCFFQPEYLRNHSSDVHTTFSTAKSSSRAFRRYAIFLFESRKSETGHLMPCHLKRSPELQRPVVSPIPYGSRRQSHRWKALEKRRLVDAMARQAAEVVWVDSHGWVRPGQTCCVPRDFAQGTKSPGSCPQPPALPGQCLNIDLCDGQTRQPCQRMQAFPTVGFRLRAKVPRE